MSDSEGISIKVLVDKSELDKLRKIYLEYLNHDCSKNCTHGKAVDKDGGNVDLVAEPSDITSDNLEDNFEAIEAPIDTKYSDPVPTCSNDVQMGEIPPQVLTNSLVQVETKSAPIHKFKSISDSVILRSCWKKDQKRTSAFLQQLRLNGRLTFDEDGLLYLDQNLLRHQSIFELCKVVSLNNNKPIKGVTPEKIKLYTDILKTIGLDSWIKHKHSKTIAFPPTPNSKWYFLGNLTQN